MLKPEPPLAIAAGSRYIAWKRQVENEVIGLLSSGCAAKFKVRVASPFSSATAGAPKRRNGAV